MSGDLRRNWLLLFIIILCGRFLVAQQFTFTYYTPDNELNPLPSAAVYSIYQDRSGYVWICVYSSGLVRYDGHTMTLFTTRQGLPNHNVMNVAEDRHGRLWVLTDAGVAVSEKPLSEHNDENPLRFVTRIGGTELVQTAVSQVAPNAIAVDSAGNVWAGTAGLGILRYRLPGPGVAHADTFSTALQADGQNEIVYALIGRRDGSIWAAAGAAILLLNPHGRGLASLPAIANIAPTHTFFESADGVLWGGCSDGALWCLREGEIEIVNRQLHDVVYSIAIDREHRLWAASYGAGLLLLDPQSPLLPGDIFRKENGLLSNSLHDICQDREGNLWFAGNGGIAKLRYNYRAFRHFSGNTVVGDRLLLAEPGIQAVIPPPDSTRQFPLWLATDQGAICLKSGNEAVTLDISQGLTSNVIYDLVIDDKERLWIGNFDGLSCLADPGMLPEFGGVLEGKPLRLDGEKKVLGFYDVGIIGVCSRLLLPGNSAGDRMVESLWFNSYKRIVGFAGEGWFIFDEESGIPLSIINTLAIDARNYLWVGTGDRGVYRSRQPVSLEGLTKLARNPGNALVSERFFEPAWNRENGAPSNEVTELICLGDTLWAATAAGVWALDRQTLRPIATFTRENGLRSDNLFSMVLSPVSGTLWGGSNEGLVEIDPRRLQVRRTVTREDGLLSNENNWLESLAAGRNGVIYFGTPRGLTLYQPALDRPNPLPPLLQFRHRHFQENGYGNNELTVEYAALSYANEKQVRYRTRLRGYDAEWSPPKPEKRIRYTNLPAYFWGKDYTFEFTAANNSGVWAETPAAFSFTVQPAWWMRWWAFLLYGGVLVLLIRAGRWLAEHWQVLFAARRRYISHYKLGPLLGKGGMGEVYEALDVNSRETVALKLLHSEMLKDPDNRQRFANEARLLASFDHPHIVKVYETGETEIQGFIAMEYLRGGTLREYLLAHHPLPPAEIQRFVGEIAAGLEAIHARGIIHRDLKTANIMLDEAGRVRIMDFGLSKSPLVSTMTSLGTVIGTLGYVAPEQITGGESDCCVDIFAFGVIIYELLTGSMPFRGENEMALIHAIFNTDPPPPSQLRPELDPAWDRLVRRCLARNPEERFQSVAEVRAVLPGGKV